MSSGNPAASAGRPADPAAAPKDPNAIINPPPSFAQFFHEPTCGFHYTEGSFLRQFAVKDTKAERYQQKEAFPRPDGVGHDEWKKAFNSADSLRYKELRNNSAASRNLRQTTQLTRTVAEEKLAAKLKAEGRPVPGPNPPLPPREAGNLSSANNSNHNHNHNPTQQPSSSSSSRKPKIKKRPTATLRPVTLTSRGDTPSPPPTFRAPRRSSRFGNYSAFFDDDSDDIYNQSSKNNSEFGEEQPSFSSGANNSTFRSNLGVDENNPFAAPRRKATYIPRPPHPHPSLVLNNLYRGPRAHPNDLSGPSSFRYDDDPEVGAQQSPFPFTFGGNNPAQGFQAPGGSRFGSYSTFPNYDSKNSHEQSSPKKDPKNCHKQSLSKDNSKIAAVEKPSSFKNDPKNAHGSSSSKDKSKIGAQQPSSKENSNNAQEQSSSKDNYKFGTQKPSSSSKNGPKIAQKQSSSSKDNSKIGALQTSSSKNNSKIGAQQLSSSKNNSNNHLDKSLFKDNSKLGAANRPSSSIDSEITARPSSSKAKMSFNAKKGKAKAEYCTCKQVKHGTKMIACEGGCENWFHVSCLNLLCEGTDGVHKFICDGCPGKTTYKRVCRLEGCNRPHSTYESVDEDGKPKTVPSKYCSLEHRDEFWARTVGRLDPLLTSQLRSYMAQTSLGDFQTFGDQPTRAGLGAQPGGSGLPGGFVATGPPHNEEGMFSFDIKLRDKCHKAIERLVADKLHYENRAKLVAMVKKYSEETTKKYAEENKVGEGAESAPKRAKNGKAGKGAARTICGFDPRVTVSDRWIDRYIATPEGNAAWKSGVIGEHTNTDFRVDVAPEYYKGICVGSGCHSGWLELRQEETVQNLMWIAEDLGIEKTKLNDMIDRVQLRLSIERERELYAKERAAEMSEENAAEFWRCWGTMKGDKNIILKLLLTKLHPTYAKT